MLNYDPIEEDPKFKELFEAIDLEVEKILKEKGIEQQLGYIHIFDKTKKELLQKKHGINWKTTQEMNPDVLLD